MFGSENVSDKNDRTVPIVKSKKEDVRIFPFFRVRRIIKGKLEKVGGTTMKQKIVVAFSGGKDCHYMLGQLLHDERYEVVGLTTTIVDGQFVTSHFVPRELLEAQARALNLPLFINELTQFTAEEFERRLIAIMTELRDRYGVTAIAYGDLYLQEVRDYKQQLLEREGFQLLTPLWGRATDELMMTMLDD